MTSFLSLATVWYARFYQAEPAPVVGTTKCPGPLCLMLALPSSGKRASFPARTLLLGHRSYRPIRQTRWALLSFGYSPRSRNLCRLLPAPAAPGFFPTLFLRIRPVMPEPVPRRVPSSASAWFFPNVLGLPKKEIWSASRFFPRTRFSAGLLSRLQLFLYVQASRLLASQIAPTAASEPAGQPRLVHPSRTCVVTFARIGYAIRPTTGNWRNEDFHLARFAALSAAHSSSKLFRTR